MNDQLISIIVPVFNAEKYLNAAVDSILNQTHSNLELFLMNDGSTDGSLDILRSYESDPRVRVFNHTNHGVPFERNMGIDMAQGEYIVFFDADDVMKPDYLEKMYCCGGGSDLVLGLFEIVDQFGAAVRPAHRFMEAGTYTLCDENISRFQSLPPFPGNKMYKTSVIREQGMRFGEVRMAEDLNMFLKFLAFAKTVTVLADTVCSYRVVNGSMSHVATKKVLDIVNSIDDSEAFVRGKGVSGRCVENFRNIRIQHYYEQANKFTLFTAVKDGKEIYHYFYSLVMEIAREGELNDRSKQIVREMKKRWLLRPLSFNRWYFARCRRLNSR